MWKIGDSVRLKSGGAKMTVVGVEERPDSDAMISVVWTTKGTPHSGVFPSEALVAASVGIRTVSVGNLLQR